jgi:hypothetical protein
MLGYLRRKTIWLGVALREASSAQPQAHWSIVRRTFELWASDVSRGNFRTTGGQGRPGSSN